MNTFNEFEKYYVIAFIEESDNSKLKTKFKTIEVLFY